MKCSSGLLAILALLTGSAQAEPATPPVASFTPHQIQTMRAIGQAVLAAKKVQAADPALAELRQGVEELRVLTKEQLAPVSSAQGKLKVLPSTLPTPPADASRADGTPQSATAEHVTRQTKARAKLVKIGERRARAAGILEAQPNSEESRQIVEDAAARLASLGEELDAALVEPPESRLQRLSQINQRLEPKRMREMQIDNDAPGLHPTLSTRVTHAAPIRFEPAIQLPKPLGARERMKVIKPNAQRKRP